MIQTKLETFEDVLAAFEASSLDDLQVSFDLGGYEVSLSLVVAMEGGEMGMAASWDGLTVTIMFPFTKTDLLDACQSLEDATYAAMLESGTGGCPCCQSDIIGQLGPSESDEFYAAADAALTEWENAGSAGNTAINPECRLCFGKGMKLWVN